MSQQINLFNPAFRRQRVTLSFGTAVALIVALTVVLSAIGGYRYQKMRGAEQELASAQGMLKAVGAYSERLKKDASGRMADSSGAAEIARLEADLKNARQNLEALSGGALGDQQGFAEYFRAFARQSVNGLWLTGFSIGSGQIAISGRTLQPDLVPAYIQRLNQESVLKGRTFAMLEMRQPKKDAAASGEAADPKRAAAAKATVPVLEFTMGTGDAAAAGIPSSAVAAKPPAAAAQAPEQPAAPTSAATPAKTEKQP